MSETRWLVRAVDALDVSLLLISAERKVAYANAAAQRLFGFTPGAELSLLNQSIERLVVPERRGELRNFDDVLQGGGARRVRSVLRREDGQRVDVTMALEPCFDDLAQMIGVSVRYYDAPQQSARPMSTTRPPLGMGVPMSSPLPPRSSSRSPAASAALPQPGLSVPSRSASRLAAAHPPHEMLQSRLRKALESLDLLSERLSIPASVAPLDDTRERARALLALEEARSLVAESVVMLESDAQIPPAPRIPRM